MMENEYPLTVFQLLFPRLVVFFCSSSMLAEINSTRTVFQFKLNFNWPNKYLQERGKAKEHPLMLLEFPLKDWSRKIGELSIFLGTVTDIVVLLVMGNFHSSRVASFL